MAPNTVMSLLPPPFERGQGKKELHRLIGPVSGDCLEKDSCQAHVPVPKPHSTTYNEVPKGGIWTKPKPCIKFTWAKPQESLRNDDVF